MRVQTTHIYSLARRLKPITGLLQAFKAYLIDMSKGGAYVFIGGYVSKRKTKTVRRGGSTFR